MPLINYEANFTLTCSSTCVTINSTGAGRFAITDTKLYIPVATLSAQDNTKLLQQLKSGFKRTINWLRRWLHNWLFVRLSLFQRKL